MPPLARMKQGRRDADAYCFYCYFFLSWVVGRVEFRKHFSMGGKLSDLATPSDEAFGLVYLEGCWNNWSYKAKKDDAASNKDKDTDGAGKGLVPPPTVYTVGRGKTAKRLGGWNTEGLRALAELQRNFKKERENQALVDSFDDAFTSYLYIVTEGKQGWKKLTDKSTSDEEDDDDSDDEPDLDLPEVVKKAASGEASTRTEDWHDCDENEESPPALNGYPVGQTAGI